MGNLNNMKWYVMKVHSGHELKIKDRIKDLAERKGLVDMIGEVKIPTVKVAELKNGKKVITDKKLMPGYMLIQLNLDNKTNYFLQSVQSVNGLVDFPNPKPLSAEEVKNMTADDDVREDESLAAIYQPGDTIKIAEGPFVGFVGEVVSVNPEFGKLKVKVDILGQKTELELQFLQVISTKETI